MQPEEGDPCAQCDHVFGQHYETFSGRGFGCSEIPSRRRDGAVCKCRGYMILWRPTYARLALPTITEGGSR